MTLMSLGGVHQAVLNVDTAETAAIPEEAKIKGLVYRQAQIELGMVLTEKGCGYLALTRKKASS